MGGCAFCDPKISFKQGDIDRVLYGDDDLYVAIPREPAMRGHLLVVSKKHIEDIASVTEKDWTVLLKMMIVSSVVSKLLMKIDESIKKVYLVVQGEKPHLHFHLKPRREGEEIGDLFLSGKELEESRWLLDGENKEEARRNTLEKGTERIAKEIALIEKHRELMNLGIWIKSKDQAKEFYVAMIEELKNAVRGLIESALQKIHEKYPC